MKKISLILLIVAIGVLAGYFWSGQGGSPRGGPTPNLTIKRVDAIPDGTLLVSGENQKLLSFAIANHSSSTEYSLVDFQIYPGLANNYPREKITNIQIFFEGVNIANASSLRFPPAIASSTPAFIIPKLSSKAFDIRADIDLSATSSGTSTALRIAVGGVDAKYILTSRRELVYKEIDGRLLGVPSGQVDDSIESAIFSW